MIQPANTRRYVVDPPRGTSVVIVGDVPEFANSLGALTDTFVLHVDDDMSRDDVVHVSKAIDAHAIVHGPEVAKALTRSLRIRCRYTRSEQRFKSCALVIVVEPATISNSLTRTLDRLDIDLLHLRPDELDARWVARFLDGARAGNTP